MILINDKFIVRFLVSELSVERIKFDFLKNYAIKDISLSHIIIFILFDNLMSREGSREGDRLFKKL